MCKRSESWEYNSEYDTVFALQVLVKFMNTWKKQTYKQMIIIQYSWGCMIMGCKNNALLYKIFWNWMHIYIYIYIIYPYVYNMKFGNKWPYLEDILLI